MNEKKHLLCPFDKKPCIHDQCAVWSALYSCCTFALSGATYSGEQPKKQIPEKHGEKPSGYRVHLFE